MTSSLGEGSVALSSLKNSRMAAWLSCFRLGGVAVEEGEELAGAEV